MNDADAKPDADGDGDADADTLNYHRIIRELLVAPKITRQRVPSSPGRSFYIWP